MAGCTSSSPTALPSTTAATPTLGDVPGTLRWALGADPTSLDPARIATREDLVVVDALFDSLTRLDAGGRAVPALAGSWSSDETATTFTFTLREDARWHDGGSVVAADVVRGLRRVADGARDRPSLHGQLLGSVQGYDAARRGESLRGVEAVDDRTVEVRLARPTPDLPILLAHPALAPVPPNAVQDPTGFGEHPVGNGAFALAEPWVHNQFLRLVPAPMRRSGPTIGELVFRVYADDETGELRWSDLAAGQVQVAPVPVARRDEAAAVVGLGGDGGGPGVRDGLQDATSVLLLATDAPLTSDVRFRRAVSLLLDREGVADRTNGARVAADALVPPPIPGAQAGPCRWCRRDVETAGELVGAAVADLGEDAIAPLLLVTADDALSVAVAEQLRAALLNLEVFVRVRAVPAIELPGVVARDDPAMVALSWSPLAPTGESFVLGLLGADTVGRAITGWRPPEVADLLGQVVATSDAAARRRRVQELERLVLDQAVVVPVHFRRGDLAVGTGVSGFVVDPFGTVDLTEVRVRGRG